MVNLVKNKMTKKIILTIGFILLFLSALSTAWALPEIDSVISGNVDFVNVGNTLTINATDKAIVNYKSFNIAENESVVFNL